MIEKKCKHCGDTFEKKKTCSKEKWELVKFCSKKCYTYSMKGKDLFNINTRNTTAWNKGIEGKKGTDNVRFTSVKLICVECTNEFLVKFYRKDKAQFCSRLCKTNYSNKGISSEQEKIRKSIEYKLWRNAVFSRDNFTCQKYGIQGGKLEAHHIKNFSKFPELRTSIENGITLSKKAHKEFHKKYGIKNNTQKQIEEFLASAQEA